MDATQHLAQQLEKQLSQGARPITYKSRGRKYTFYWLKSGHRLAVEVQTRRRLPSNPAVEALARKIGAVWSCPECGKVFARKGKQKFCTPAHAARHRKARWLKAQQRARAVVKYHRGEVLTTAERRLFRLSG